MTLRAGQVRGSTGCTRLSGRYGRVGQALAFELSDRRRGACAEQVALVASRPDGCPGTCCQLRDRTRQRRCRRAADRPRRGWHRGSALRAGRLGRPGRGRVAAAELHVGRTNGGSGPRAAGRPGVPSHPQPRPAASFELATSSPPPAATASSARTAGKPTCSASVRWSGQTRPARPPSPPRRRPSWRSSRVRRSPWTCRPTSSSSSRPTRATASSSSAQRRSRAPPGCWLLCPAARGSEDTVTLRLEGGTLVGEGPCGPFAGRYVAEGVFLTLDDISAGRRDWLHAQGRAPGAARCPSGGRDGRARRPGPPTPRRSRPAAGRLLARWSSLRRSTRGARCR